MKLKSLKCKENLPLFAVFLLVLLGCLMVFDPLAIYGSYHHQTDYFESYQDQIKNGWYRLNAKQNPFAPPLSATDKILIGAEFLSLGLIIGALALSIVSLFVIKEKIQKILNCVFPVFLLGSGATTIGISFHLYSTVWKNYESIGSSKFPPNTSLIFNIGGAFLFAAILFFEWLLITSKKNHISLYITNAFSVVLAFTSLSFMCLLPTKSISEYIYCLIAFICVGVQLHFVFLNRIHSKKTKALAQYAFIVFSFIIFSMFAFWKDSSGFEKYRDITTSNNGNYTFCIPAFMQTALNILFTALSVFLIKKLNPEYLIQRKKKFSIVNIFLLIPLLAFISVFLFATLYQSYQSSGGQYEHEGIWLSIFAFFTLITKIIVFAAILILGISIMHKNDFCKKWRLLVPVLVVPVFYLSFGLFLLVFPDIQVIRYGVTTHTASPFFVWQCLTHFAYLNTLVLGIALSLYGVLFYYRHHHLTRAFLLILISCVLAGCFHAIAGAYEESLAIITILIAIPSIVYSIIRLIKESKTSTFEGDMISYKNSDSSQ